MGPSHVVLHLNQTSDRCRPMAGSMQMRCMDEQEDHRLWRSSTGRSEVTTRWLAISICTSIGSIISDMIVGMD
jgi:hypothetical protein